MVDQAFPDEAFWRFSLAFYARPGVADALIALQDRAGLDVNLMLFALWLGALHGQRFTRAEMRAAEAAIAPLRREIVAPLRGFAPPAEGRARMRTSRSCGAGSSARTRGRANRAIAACSHVALAGKQSADRRAAAEANLALYLGAEAQSAEAVVLCRGLRDFLSRD